MKKKFAALVITAAMAAATLAGCGSSSSQAPADAPASAETTDNTAASAAETTDTTASATEEAAPTADKMTGDISILTREDGSGTRGAFEELVDLKDACKYANELDSTGAVIAKVASTPGAIGYASLDALDDSVKALSLEGVEATAENIKAGNYFLSRPFVMATKGEISEQNDLVQAWFDYVMGDEGQQIASEVGLITVK